MQIETLSTFPEMFEGPMSTSIIGRARSAGILDFRAHDLREWTHDRHRSTDDEIYGGGAGLLMKVEPIFEALDSLLGCTPEDPVDQADPATVIFFAPIGERFSQDIAAELSHENRIIFVCGHYEGFDERVYTRADRILSLGDYVLTGGELPAMVVTDAVCRLLPGVLGDANSALDESFSDGLLEYPQYTRPATYRGLEVPPVLLSGDHARIAEWRRRQSIERTARLRPDLFECASLSEGERIEHR